MMLSKNNTTSKFNALNRYFEAWVYHIILLLLLSFAAVCTLMGHIYLFIILAPACVSLVLGLASMFSGTTLAWKNLGIVTIGII